MKPNTVCSIGIDVGSTTLKVVVLNDRNEIIYKVYRRHKADFNTLKSASNLNGNLNCSKELEHYAS